MFMRIPTILLSLPLVAAASCGSAQSGDSTSAATASTPAPTETKGPFAVASLGAFEEPWALAIEPGTNRIFITEKAGTMKVVDPATGKSAPVSGTPKVSYGGQGGFADVAFAPDYAQSKTIYLSWVAENAAGERYGVVGRGKLNCADMAACAVEGLSEIWRQTPALKSFGQFAVRLAFAPDGKYLFVASGDLAKGDPAQDISNNLGAIVRLNLDGTPAAGNPLAGKGSPDIWTYGHRNPLGLKFDASGQLWDVEHGPAGGDEINKIVPGDNYGWPVVSNGDNYNGTPIPRHPTHPEFHAPAISWNPVIAPGDMIFYSGKLWPEWKGNAIVAGLKTQALVRVKLSGDKGIEEARYDMGQRMRGLAEASDGAIYAIEDGKGGRLLRLTPAK
jgi:glucose/arabinose dehydrogenase